MAMDVARDDRRGAAKTFATTQRAMLTIGAATILIAAAVSLALPQRWIATVPGYSTLEVRLSIVALVIYGVACLQNSISFAGLRSDGQMHVGVLMHTAIYLTENLALIMSVLLGGGPAIAAVALALGRVIGSIAQNILLRRRLPWLANLRSQPDWARITALAKPAGAAMAIPASQMLLSQGATVTLGLAAGAAAVPIFTAARTLSRIGLQAAQLVATTVMPEFSAAAAKNQSDVKSKLLVLLLALSILLVTPFCVLLAAWGPRMISIWTNGRIDAPLPMIGLMALSILLTAIWLPISSLLVALNRQSAFSYYYLLLAAFAIPLEMGLARSMGPTGSALALLVVDILMTTLILLNLPKTGVEIHHARQAYKDIAVRLVATLGLKLRH
ncbi:hypothetical protein [Stakelama saccharophila]|uniref:Polysaccharide biosynthesis protein n=1 Tax=Stakelama saccharophila TaxID=3075605 RepID=A0ABZ0B8T3_9SPHN|nr:hypothetical protein [Stakelama sp. W311]WNO53788.1 hypothetical protein RPR59_00570 [Stakelama sp. W311]